MRRTLLLPLLVSVLLMPGTGAALGEEPSEPGPTAMPAVPEHGVGLVDPTTGIWYLRDPGGGSTTAFYFGNPADIPFTGDWDCDGVDTPGLYRQSDGYVYLRNSNTQGVADRSFFFGNPGDVPLAGDFDGDGCDTVSLYRPSESRVYLIDELGSGDAGLGAADASFVFGNPGDHPFAGDFDGDGIDEVGLHRRSTGLVYMRFDHSSGPADLQFFYGDAGDVVFAGDWNGTATDSVGLRRTYESVFYLNDENESGAADRSVVYGASRMVPVSGAFGPLPGTDPPPPRDAQLAGEFTTYHPCCEARVTNIHLIADAVDGAVVAPGATFSINDHVGERTAEKGYVAAGAIIGGELYCCDHPENIGGGTSQFATTFFNAVFFAGLEIVAHRPHSLYFTRYPMGREATLGYPGPDVVFRNDTHTPVRIETSHTATSITVRLIGSNEGRVVTAGLSGTATPEGGGEVTVTRTIVRPNGVVTSESWFHRYRERIEEEPVEPPPPPPPPGGGGPDPV